MIAQALTQFQPAGWQQELARGISQPLELLRTLHIDPAALTEPVILDSQFRLRVPRGFVARMRRGDPHDPLLRQVLPLAAENRHVRGFVTDPVGDLAAEAVPGVLHKYQGRALLVTTGACAIHCRYCFRRHFPYADSNPALNQWQEALAYIAGDGSITEVILSGGDPLMLVDERLGSLAHALAEIPEVHRLRVHTRLPIVLPERIDDRLIGWLTGTRLKPIVVVHANHANEIDASVHAAIQRLRDADITVLNQSVLLAGVNDSVQALCNLSEMLFDAGVLPYYVHLLDPVAGAAHFEVSKSRATGLLDEVRVRLPGYLVPRLVREYRGAAHKLSIV
jgi:EF-P beta-lysylation protein EpmB